MTRENFTEGSIEQLIFDYWDGKLPTQSDLENALSEMDKHDLVYFIMAMQTKGAFRTIIHS